MLRVLTSIDSRGSRLRLGLQLLLNSCLLLPPSCGTDRSALKGGSASLTGLLLLLLDVLTLWPAASAWVDFPCAFCCSTPAEPAATALLSWQGVFGLLLLPA
jgi:hypothetical protein